jgi:hypothetical protein
LIHDLKEANEYIKILEDRIEMYENRGDITTGNLVDLVATLRYEKGLLSKEDLIEVVIQKEKRIHYLQGKLKNRGISDE